MLGVLTVTAAVVFVTYNYSGYFALAQVNNTSTQATQGTANITKKQQQEQQQVNITDSIPIQSTISQALRSEIQIPMDEALTIAQNVVGTNSSSVIAAFLSFNK
jgi:predicted PurR-regulated permease PerM